MEGSLPSNKEELILSGTSGSPRRITFEIEIKRTIQIQQFQVIITFISFVYFSIVFIELHIEV
jgi:hypothetical protein